MKLTSFKIVWVGLFFLASSSVLAKTLLDEANQSLDYLRQHTMYVLIS
ncbi:hypothetical protein J8M20_09125 [Pseudoalteromonas luteoviolacea]|nr:hypothetical protein [Pseudoalteromonas luteoviolacea]MBQ4811499.1 hypothetical protein [Pseudoalteromonas luteoviolacea]